MSLLLCTACETDWEICGCPLAHKSTVPINVVLEQNKRLRAAAAKLKAKLDVHDAECGRLMGCCDLPEVAHGVVKELES